MLDKNDALRVGSCIDVIRDAVKGKYRGAEGLTLETQLWLAEKLEQTNAECSRVTDELQTSNEALAKFREHYEE